MTDLQFAALTFILALATLITRFLPFAVFGRSKKTPAFVTYLGKVLPAAMMGLLVVYCFRDVTLTVSGTVPLIIASVSVVALHLWKHNTILSIAAGTAIYMVLIRII